MSTRAENNLPDYANASYWRKGDRFRIVSSMLSRFGEEYAAEFATTQDNGCLVHYRDKDGSRRAINWTLIEPVSDKHAELGLSDGEHVCDTCEGEGTVDETLGGESFSDPEAKCPDCEGAGWWADREPTDDSVLTGAALHRAIADAMDAGEQPSVFETIDNDGDAHYAGDWWRLVVRDDNGLIVRRKPTTRHLIDENGVRHEWPEPLSDPKPGDQVFITFGSVAPVAFYNDIKKHAECLEQGRIFANAKARDAHERALIAASGGQS